MAPFDLSPLTLSHPVLTRDYLPSTSVHPAPKIVPRLPQQSRQEHYPDLPAAPDLQIDFDEAFGQHTNIPPISEDQMLQNTATHDYISIEGWRERLPTVRLTERGYTFSSIDIAQPRPTMEMKTLALMQHVEDSNDRTEQSIAAGSDFFSHLIFQAEKDKKLLTLAAMILFKGDITPRDAHQACLYIFRAHAANERNAALKLGIMSLKGISDKDNSGRLITLDAEPQKARDPFKKASELDHPLADFYIGRLQEEGIGGDKNLPAALASYTRSADLGYAEAQNRVGTIHSMDGQPHGILNEYGIVTDDVTAKYYYELASRQGNDFATHNLAMLCLESSIVPDKQRALQCLTTLAQKGDVEAQYHAGKMLVLNQVPSMSDKPLGLSYLQSAALSGDMPAHYLLGYLHEQTDSPFTNPVAAYKHHFISAQAGNTKSMNSLGLLFRDNAIGKFIYRNSIDMSNLDIEDPNIGNKGYKKRYDLAIHWLDKAARLEKSKETYSGAALNLAVMYYKGNLIIRNHLLAEDYLNMAIACGDKEAKKFLRDLLNSKMR